MASITYTLPRFPLLNQRTEASNPNDDCVFTSNAAIVRYFYGGNITGSDIKAKDADYGPKYVGFASQSRILDTMASLGVRFARVFRQLRVGHSVFPFKRLASEDVVGVVAISMVAAAERVGRSVFRLASRADTGARVVRVRHLRGRG